MPKSVNDPVTYGDLVRTVNRGVSREVAQALNGLRVTPGQLRVDRVTATRKALFVRPSGSDTTGDGSEAAPYATLKKALATIPTILAGVRYVIDVTGVDEDMANFYLPLIQSADPMQVFLTPGGVEPQSVFEPSVCVVAAPTVVGTLAAAANITWSSTARTALLEATVAGASWTTDQHKGKMVRGSGLLHWGWVWKNTANKLSIVSPFTSWTGDIVEISPGATLRNGIIAERTKGPWMFYGIHLRQDDVNLYALNAHEDSNVTAYFCKVDGFGTSYATHMEARNCLVRNRIGQVGTNMNFNYSYVKDVPTIIQHGSANGDEDLWLQCVVENCMSLGHYNNNEAGMPFQIEQCEINAKSGFYGVYYRGGAPCSIRACVIGSQFSGLGVFVLRGGHLVCVNVGGSVTTGVGIQVGRNARATIDSACTLTGASGDVKIGNRAADTYAALVAAGFIFDSATGAFAATTVD